MSAGSVARRARLGFFHTSRFFCSVRRLALVGVGPVCGLWRCLRPPHRGIQAGPGSGCSGATGRSLNPFQTWLEELEPRLPTGGPFGAAAGAGLALGTILSDDGVVALAPNSVEIRYDNGDPSPAPARGWREPKGSRDPNAVEALRGLGPGGGQGVGGASAADGGKRPPAAIRSESSDWPAEAGDPEAGAFWAGFRSLWDPFADQSGSEPTAVRAGQEGAAARNDRGGAAPAISAAPLRSGAGGPMPMTESGQQPDMAMADTRVLHRSQPELPPLRAHGTILHLHVHKPTAAAAGSLSPGDPNILATEGVPLAEMSVTLAA